MPAARVESVEVTGLYPVEDSPDPCHLIELRLPPGGPPLDLTGVTQPGSGLPGADWQTPFEPHLLDEAGTSGRPLDPMAARAVPPPARLCFFFHFLRLDRPLLTPVGPVRLPPPTTRPERLAFLRYPLL